MVLSEKGFVDGLRSGPTGWAQLLRRPGPLQIVNPGQKAASEFHRSVTAKGQRTKKIYQGAPDASFAQLDPPTPASACFKASQGTIPIGVTPLVVTPDPVGSPQSPKPAAANRPRRKPQGASALPVAQGGQINNKKQKKKKKHACPVGVDSSTYVWSLRN